MLKKATGLLQEEARVAIPAAGRAAVHGAKKFLRSLPEQYAKERKKR
jgi:hypothetical protein